MAFFLKSFYLLAILFYTISESLTLENAAETFISRYQDNVVQNVNTETRFGFNICQNFEQSSKLVCLFCKGISCFKSTTTTTTTTTTTAPVSTTTTAATTTAASTTAATTTTTASTSSTTPTTTVSP